MFREGSKSVYDYEKLIEGDGDGIYYHVEPAGRGYVHTVTESEVAARFAELPAHLVSTLNCVVLPRMTRKRKIINIYGMQWAETIYLYPMPADLRVGDKHTLTEAVLAEARQFGATIEEHSGGPVIQWTPETIKPYYLENILLHELGHVVDRKNTSEKDREAFAEHFARQYGRWPKRKRKRWKPDS